MTTARFAWFWTTRNNHGLAHERRVCVLTGTSHGTLPLRWQIQLSETHGTAAHRRRSAPCCAQAQLRHAAHRHHDWRKVDHQQLPWTERFRAKLETWLRCLSCRRSRGRQRRPRRARQAARPRCLPRVRALWRQRGRRCALQAARPRCFPRGRSHWRPRRQRRALQAIAGRPGCT
jgi:hypothetical protein